MKSTRIVVKGSFAPPFTRSLAPLTHFPHFAPLASLARSAALIRLLAPSLTPEFMGKSFMSMI